MRIFIFYSNNNGEQLGANVEVSDDFDFSGEGSIEALIARLPEANVAGNFVAFQPFDSDDDFPSALNGEGNEIPSAEFVLDEEEADDAEEASGENLG